MQAILVITLGAACGVIINYLADVLPIYRKPGIPLCSNCVQKFTLYNYLISFKCKNCGQPVSLRTLLVLIFSIAAALLFWLFPYQNLSFWWMLPVMIFLGVILVIDIEYRVVLIQTSIFGLVLMFLIGLVNQGFTLPGLLITLAGGAAGLIILLALYYFGAFFSKTLSKARGQQIDEIAFGFGDVYAGTFLGLMMGWPNIIGTLILAVLLSGAFSLLYVLVLLILRRYKAYSAIPYTPFLILGAIVLPYLIK